MRGPMHHHHHHRQPTVIFKRACLQCIGGLGSEVQAKGSRLSFPITSPSSNHCYSAEHCRHRLTSPEEAGLGADIVAAAALLPFGCCRWAVCRWYANPKKNESNSATGAEATERRLT